MSMLVIQLPPRPRLQARQVGGDAAAPWRLPQEWSFVLSDDGRTVVQAGQSAAALLPRADSLVLVLAEADVGWHRLPIPRAPAARLRAALAGVMEEALLDDDDALHFALAPGAAPGREGWIAVTHRPWLAAALAALEGAGRTVERVVPASMPSGQPGDAARGHFFTAEAGDDAVPWLTLAHAEGVACLRLAGGLARALLPAAGEAVRWTTTPAAAAAAESWLGAPVPLLSDAERALEAAQGAANLRQFDLAARHRGSRALRAGTQRFFSREWRSVRLGLVALAVLHLLGLNAYAWQQREALVAKRQAMAELLRSTHPGVRAVLDAPVQMQRETERLRAAAGRAGDNDLEVLLAAAAAAWPDGQGPVQTLRFESGLLTLAVPGWAEAQQQQFRERLRGAGFAAEFEEGRLTVTRAAT
ncbi:MAG: general secretion pathway protein GspL [Betaproteobacteria bacterium]|jgi:general secretion pathway protein L|nr:general secretion pathway protein GspL [Betaproteobacteria bacterium]MBK7277126.1 general secretion pathway protein GspL [Betaproteobacteria bacterium]MBK7461184.1 general secretion pathway protein GspL [Betaproteobacteria bacterium]MBK7515825.1 general secretion pathway protein GspL [Betaproteobacteria bacterium]MBK8865112.1 general secretion pathway protein GspL [Betaproteobacteria bacterium]